METQYWTKVKEFHGVELLRNPETFECRILPIERQAEPKTKSVETPATPEQMARAEASWAAHYMERQATPIQTVKPLGFEEQIKNDWRTRPDIRAEFISLTSYEAYCRAVRDGRTKVYCKA